MGIKMLEQELEEFNKWLPTGYEAFSEMGSSYWSSKDNGQYLLLLLIAVVIFFITSILFNSLKAWNVKIVPITLTVLSTVLGFIPFLIGESKEAFWFPLAAGTIGGLVMSMVGMFLFLPIYALKTNKKK